MQRIHSTRQVSLEYNAIWVQIMSNSSDGLILIISRAEMPAERAGGYKCGLACQRALQEAMQGLYYGNPPT